MKLGLLVAEENLNTHTHTHIHTHVLTTHLRTCCTHTHTDRHTINIKYTNKLLSLSYTHPIYIRKIRTKQTHIKYTHTHTQTHTHTRARTHTHIHRSNVAH